MRQLIQGTLDIGLMYTPSHAPGLIVEHLFDELLVMVSTRPDTRWPGDDCIYVEWGPGVYARHRESFPDLERPAQVVNSGWLGIQLILANGGSCSRDSPACANWRWKNSRPVDTGVPLRRQRQLRRRYHRAVSNGRGRCGMPRRYGHVQRPDQCSPLVRSSPARRLPCCWGPPRGNSVCR
jgi:DNA-binding transcriptional LysR family regulator